MDYYARLKHYYIMDKIVKVIIDGKEYIVTDKQAQQMLEVISDRVGIVENQIIELRNDLDNTLTWRVIE